ncbi:MAG: PSD1 and planctomycete cytochrome C domain-containing protein [Pirellulales bacterium]|nr:PSD1 and planctomycete cytochrome C domain-containing protein [Pirellulales bacterium]
MKLLGLVLVAVPACQIAAAAAAADFQFNRDIRPILSNNCFACHGPDANKREAGLRLDREPDARAKLESGETAIVPGDTAASALVARITSSDDSLRMPPSDSGKSLTPGELELLTQWVAAGAAYQKHWSLEPIARPPLPVVSRGDWVRNPIDAFVLAKLDEQGLAPSTEAERTTLARRVALDVVGLPLEAHELERFLADPDPLSYEAFVDRLLASPHFGERMAMFWLDLVRYADSVGYHGDQAVSVSPFRDWVIAAFNANMPFDQFTREQLAGDLLPTATREQKVASGYNRLGMMTAEGGAQDKEYLAKYAAERVRNLGGTWLGLTLGCCECHDHKFDPLATRDFYRLEAFFADIEEKGFYGNAHVTGQWGPVMQVPTAAQSAELARIDADLTEANAVLNTTTPELAATQAAWEQTFAPATEWAVLRPQTSTSSADAVLTVSEDGSIFATGGDDKAAVDAYTIAIAGPLNGITALRIDALPDDSLPKKGPGRAANGNFVLTEVSASLQASADAEPQPLRFGAATASFEQLPDEKDKANPHGGWKIAAAIDADAQGEKWGWAILPEAGQANHAVFELEGAAALDVPAGGSLTIVLRQAFGTQHTLGKFRLLSTSAPRPVRAAGAGLPRNVRDLLANPVAQRSEAQRDELAAYYRSIAPTLEPYRQRAAKLQQAREALNRSITTTLYTVSREPREIRVLSRGNWMDESGEVVEPGVPSALPQPLAHEGRLSRLDLANWLVARDNPLASRTLANRLWKLYFGAGLSTKLDDIGAQGDWPSHPELLDWLAGRLIDSGWDIKALVRLMVTSSAYRQSSVVTPKLHQRDPFNRLLARQGRYRLDAEIVRDQAVAASGLLVDSIGGRSVFPYQPTGYWSHLNFPVREWENSQGDGLYRRSVYTHWQRQYLHPMLVAFDAPSREECTADRVRSNTPLQALVLLNDAEFVEVARVFAERLLREAGPASDERIDWAMRRLLARAARSEEKQLLAALFEAHLAQYRADAAATAALLAVGAHPAPNELDAAELAAWTSVTRALLNLHETVTRN